MPGFMLVLPVTEAKVPLFKGVLLGVLVPSVCVRSNCMPPSTASNVEDAEQHLKQFHEKLLFFLSFGPAWLSPKPSTFHVPFVILCWLQLHNSTALHNSMFKEREIHLPFTLLPISFLLVDLSLDRRYR